MLRDLTPERWEQLSRLIDEASAKTTAERVAYLDEACAGDHLLRSYAERLLMEAERGWQCRSSFDERGERAEAAEDS